MKLTVVGRHLARAGLRFTYMGETDPGCGACRLRKVCHGDLRPGRTYTITTVRPVQHDVCHVFEGPVQVVEVDPAPEPLRVIIPASATRGTAVTKRWEECGASCLLKAQCNPSALAEGQSASIRAVEGPVACLVGRELRFARVEPQ